MKLSKTIPFAILSMAVVALTGCKNEFDGYEFYSLIEEVPATCTRGGMKAHYESKPNDKGNIIYLNVDKKKVEVEDLIIPATGHNMTYYPEVYSTCDEEGTIAHYHCSNCNLDYEDEAGKTLVDDLHRSTKGHVLDHVWTPTPGSDTTHCHKCAREGCNHYEDEEPCVFDRQVVKDEYAVEDEDNQYYYSCACGRKGTETFTYYAPTVVDADKEGWQKDARNYGQLEEYDPSKDPITLSNINISASDYMAIPEQHKGHIFGQYNIDYNDGINLAFNFKFTKDENASYFVVYLGNQENEEGLQIQFRTTRDDGYIEGYCFSTLGGLLKEDNTPFYGSGTEFYFMTKPGKKTDNEHKVEIKLTPFGENSNEGADFYKINVAIDGYNFKKNEAEPDIDNLIVGFPEGYFVKEDLFTPNHTVVRISSHNSNPEPDYKPHVYIKDAEFPARLILMDDEGGCIGASRDDVTFKIPPLVRKNNKFVGWFDTRGNRVTDDSIIDSRVIAYPYFIETNEEPAFTNVTLSDLNILNPGYKDSTTNNEIASGFEEGFRRIPVSAKTTHVKVAFVAQFKFASPRGKKVVDDYFQFGLPYDYKDNQTRFVFRINADSGVTSLRGYVGGPATSLGAHGTEGTFFNDDDFAMAEGVSYLIAMSYEESQYGAGLDYTIEITNLATNSYRGFTFPGVKFINSDDFSFANPYRNYFSVIRSRADAVLTMSNAW